MDIDDPRSGRSRGGVRVAARNGNDPVAPDGQHGIFKGWSACPVDEPGTVQYGHLRTFRDCGLTSKHADGDYQTEQ